MDSYRYCTSVLVHTTLIHGFYVHFYPQPLIMVFYVFNFFLIYWYLLVQVFKGEPVPNSHISNLRILIHKNLAEDKHYFVSL